MVLRRASNSPTDEEYMEVSYYFHDGECIRILVSHHKKKKKASSDENERFAARRADPERNKRPHVRNWIMTYAVAAQSSSLRVSAAKSRKKPRQLFRTVLYRPRRNSLFYFFSYFFFFFHRELRAQSRSLRASEKSFLVLCLRVKV